MGKPTQWTDCNGRRVLAILLFAGHGQDLETEAEGTEAEEGLADHTLAPDPGIESRRDHAPSQETSLCLDQDPDLCL